MSEGHAFFKCPNCGTESNNPQAILEGWCDRCRELTGVRLEEVFDEVPILLGRVQTGLVVIDDETFVVMALYDIADTTKVIARYRLHPDAAGHWVLALARAAKAGLEDQAVRHAGT